MTRVTSFGRKRTYLQAGLDQTPGEETITRPHEVDANNITVAGQTQTPRTVEGHVGIGVEGEPPKKKKRIRKKKPKGGVEVTTAKEGEGDTAATEDSQAQRKDEGKAGSTLSNKAMKLKKWKEREKEKKQRRECTTYIRHTGSAYRSGNIQDCYLRRRGDKNVSNNTMLKLLVSRVGRRDMLQRIAQR